jgi:Ca2+-binding EF-hand superfamily protein
VTDDQLDELWKLFAKFCDKEGKLNKPALKKMLGTDDALMKFGSLSYMKSMSDERFDSLFRAFDVDKSGFVDFVECAILLFVMSTDDLDERLRVHT